MDAPTEPGAKLAFKFTMQPPAAPRTPSMQRRRRLHTGAPPVPSNPYTAALRPRPLPQPLALALCLGHTPRPRPSSQAPCPSRKNSPEWWAKMGGFGWAYARQGALWVPKENPLVGPAAVERPTRSRLFTRRGGDTAAGGPCSARSTGTFCPRNGLPRQARAPGCPRGRQGSRLAGGFWRAAERARAVGGVAHNCAQHLHRPARGKHATGLS